MISEHAAIPDNCKRKKIDIKVNNLELRWNWL